MPFNFGLRSDSRGDEPREVHPQFQTPGFSTIGMGMVSAALFVALSAVSTNVLADSASAVGLLIAFYYGLTALACPWYFRSSLRSSRRNLLLRGVLPLLGGAFMVAAFALSVKSYLPAANSYSSIGGIGGVFLLGAGSLLLGGVLIAVLWQPQRAFFRRPRADRSAAQSMLHPEPAG